MKYCIIKNKETFGKIKLAKKILLHQKFEERDGDYGISSEEFAKKWFITPKGRALFKTYGSEYHSRNGFLRVENELICNALAHQLEIPVAEYEPAEFKIFEGLVTYDYQQDGDRIIDGSKFLKMGGCAQLSNLQEFLTAAKNINRDGEFKVDLKQMEKNLFGIIVFDSLTFQEDRGLQNILFLLNSKDNSIRVAPLTDNEFAFGGFQESVKFNEVGVEKQSFLNIHSQNVLFTIEPMGYIGSKNRYVENVKDIIKYASKNPELKNFLIQTLKKLDYKKAIEDINAKGNIIPEDYELVLLEYEKIAKDTYKNNIKKFKEQDMEVGK